MPSGVKDIQLLELKDTISQLNKTISTQNELISSLQKMLEERNAKDSEKDLLIANLQSQLAYLKNKVFGSTSEIRHDQLDGQLNLFGTPVGDEKPAEVIEPEVISVKGYTKERKPKATYDDKYNSVRSICKHFFTDIVGLSIKFFCVSLRHMSIVAGVFFQPVILDGVVEDCRKLVLDGLEIGLGVGITIFIPITGQLVLPMADICGLDFVQGHPPEIRCDLQVDQKPLVRYGGGLEPMLHILHIQLNEVLKGHPQASSGLTEEVTLPL